MRYGGQESTGLVERHSWAEDKVTVWLLDQKLQICCKAEEVWLAEPPGRSPRVPPPEQGTQAPAYRPVSRNIDVPKRFVWENLGSERHVGVEVGVLGCLGLGKECRTPNICLLLKIPVGRDTVRVFFLLKKNLDGHLFFPITLLLLF